MRLLKNRVFVFGCTMLILISVIVVQIFNLQVFAGVDSAQQANTAKEKTRNISGERGKIFDVNMVPLAYDVPSYDIQFHRDPNRSQAADFAEYSRVLLNVIDIIESNGYTTIDTFYMKKDASGNLVFDWGTQNEEAQATREKYWRDNFYIRVRKENDARTAQQIFDDVCAYFGVPNDIGFERQRKVMSIWQESQATMYLSLPVTIAKNVDLNTVSEIKAKGTELPDIGVLESTMRVYPQFESAAHIVGYVGAIPESSVADYQEQGYAPSDNVGVAGVERTMEDQLSSKIGYRQGSQVVEVNSLGRVMRELSYEAPVDGNSIVLTIDMDLQRVAEEALKDNIDRIRVDEETKLIDPAWLEDNADSLEQYQESDKDVELANSGAVVVMDVKNGNLKALVSYPSYDPNAFVRGDLDLINYYINDEAAHQPMFNRAIATKDTPGSIFKMVTALAGLMEGVIGPEDTVEDAGAFTKYLESQSRTALAQAPSCWSRTSHGHVDVAGALQDSCNYYFFEVIDRLGTMTGKSGIELLDQWAIKLGLGSRTGVELPLESRGLIAGPDTLYNPAVELTGQETAKPRLSAAKIKEILVTASENKGMEYEDERFDRMVDAIMDLAATDLGINDLAAPIRDILLDNSGFSATEIASQHMGTQIIQYLRDIKWTVNESMWAAVGQSIHQYSPIAIARYIAAIVNGGTVYEAQLVDRIVDASGELVIDKQPVAVNTIEGAASYLEYIKDGMSDVVNTNDDGHGGTAETIFEDFEYRDIIAGKTGTAEKTYIDVENNAWFVAFAPYEDPEIAIVVYIPAGLSGGNAGWCARDILQYWMDNKELSGNDIPSYGVLIP